MNLSFVKENGKLVAKTTEDAMKGWQSGSGLALRSEPGDEKKGTFTERRNAMMIWTLQYNTVWETANDLRKLVPGPLGGGGSLKDNALEKALKLYNDGKSLKQIEDAFPKK